MPPKDIRAFSARAEELGRGESVAFLREVDAINLRRRGPCRAARRRRSRGSVFKKNVTVLGAAFKPYSDDIRDSPALDVAVRLHGLGAWVTITDPAAIENARRIHPQLNYVEDRDEAIRGADALILVTEWDQYRRELQPEHAASLAAGRVVVDGRNGLDAAAWREAAGRTTAWAVPDRVNARGRTALDPLELAWRRLRRRSIGAILVLAAIVAMFAATIAFYAFPPDDRVSASSPADVIYIIGPATPARIAMAKRLRNEGVARAILVSVYAEGITADLPLCAESGVTCAIADPDTTKERRSFSRAMRRPTRHTGSWSSRSRPMCRARVMSSTAASPETRASSGVPGIGRLPQWVQQIAYQSAPS